MPVLGGGSSGGSSNLPWEYIAPTYPSSTLADGDAKTVDMTDSAIIPANRTKYYWGAFGTGIGVSGYSSNFTYGTFSASNGAILYSSATGLPVVYTGDFDQTFDVPYNYSNGGYTGMQLGTLPTYQGVTEAGNIACILRGFYTNRNIRLYLNGAYSSDTIAYPLTGNWISRSKLRMQRVGSTVKMWSDCLLIHTMTYTGDAYIKWQGQLTSTRLSSNYTTSINPVIGEYSPAYSTPELVLPATDSASLQRVNIKDFGEENPAAPDPATGLENKRPKVLLSAGANTEYLTTTNWVASGTGISNTATTDTSVTITAAATTDAVVFASDSSLNPQGFTGDFEISCTVSDISTAATAFRGLFFDQTAAYAATNQLNYSLNLASTSVGGYRNGLANSFSYLIDAADSYDIKIECTNSLLYWHCNGVRQTFNTPARPAGTLYLGFMVLNDAAGTTPSNSTVTNLYAVDKTAVPYTGSKILGERLYTVPPGRYIECVSPKGSTDWAVNEEDSVKSATNSLLGIAISQPQIATSGTYWWQSVLRSGNTIPYLTTATQLAAGDSLFKIEGSGKLKFFIVGMRIASLTSHYEMYVDGVLVITQPLAGYAHGTNRANVLVGRVHTERYSTSSATYEIDDNGSVIFQSSIEVRLGPGSLASGNASHNYYYIIEGTS